MLARRKSAKEGKIYQNERNRSGNLEAEFLHKVLKSGGISKKNNNNSFRDDEEDAAVIVSNVGVFADGRTLHPAPVLRRAGAQRNANYAETSEQSSAPTSTVHD